MNKQHFIGASFIVLAGFGFAVAIVMVEKPIASNEPVCSYSFPLRTEIVGDKVYDDVFGMQATITKTVIVDCDIIK